MKFDRIIWRLSYQNSCKWRRMPFWRDNWQSEIVKFWHPVLFWPHLKLSEIDFFFSIYPPFITQLCTTILDFNLTLWLKRSGFTQNPMRQQPASDWRSLDAIPQVYPLMTLHDIVLLMIWNVSQLINWPVNYTLHNGTNLQSVSNVTPVLVNKYVGTIDWYRFQNAFSVLCPKDFCKNGGTCVGNHVCKCQHGFYGDSCDQSGKSF